MGYFRDFCVKIFEIFSKGTKQNIASIAKIALRHILFTFFCIFSCITLSFGFDVPLTLAQRLEKGADMIGVMRKGRRGRGIDISSFTLDKENFTKIKTLIFEDNQLK